jgi:hypothetical protein
MSFHPGETMRPLPPLISPMSWCSVGTEMAMLNPTPGAAAWPTANRASYVPLYLPCLATFPKVWVANGGTVSGNFDIGVYSMETLGKLFSIGSTAQAGASAVQAVTAGWTLPRGRYYLALVFNNNTATIQRVAPTLLFVKALGLAVEASAFPLPGTAVPAVTGNFVPFFGLSRRSTV